MREWLPHLRQRLAPLSLSPDRETEIIEELSEHLDQRYDELRSEGRSASEARRLALEELLEPDALANYMRPLRQAQSAPAIQPGGPKGAWLGDLWQDLRYAARMLGKQPGFAVAAIVTLALGMGVNSAVFSLVDATLLRPLPFPHPERLVVLWERSDASSRGIAAPLNLIDWNTRNRTFETIAGFVPNVGSMVMSRVDGTAETIPRQWVTAGFFQTLGTKAIAGRTFLPEDDKQKAKVVVLSESFWRARFNSDQRVIGTNVRLDGEAWTITGVVGDEAQVMKTSIWALLPIQGAGPAARRQYSLLAIGRLKSGISIEAAQSDIAAVADGLAREYPKTNTGRGVMLEPMREVAIGGDLRRTSAIFLGIVGFVLLICCSNMANLLLARATVRSRELAIRSALGADRARIVRQLLTESMLLALIGGGLGLAAGAAIVQIAPSLMPVGLLPAAITLSFDLRVIVFCGAAVLLAGILFGLAPVWQANELVSTNALASGSRTTTGRGGKLRSLLVAGEVATAVLLLFGAGLLLRTLMVVENVDRGYGAESVLTMIVDPPGMRYRTMPALLQFYKDVTQEVITQPGVRAAAWATTLPLGRSYQNPRFFEVVGAPPLAVSKRPTADYQIVSPNYFSALDVPVVAGRGFDDRDVSTGVPVCIVNEAFVRRYLQGQSPIGARVSLTPTTTAQATPVVREIVGVARQVKGRPDEVEDLLQIYVPLAQDTPGDIFLMVRPVSGSAEALVAPVRAAMARVDRDQLVSVRGMMTIEDVAREATSRHRFRAVLVMTFAGLALALAMAGLFGMIAYSVQQRVREFGLRRALGATSGDVLRAAIGSAARVIGAGAVIGLALAMLLGRLLTTMLFGVETADPVTFACVGVVLVVTATVAIAGPAWRATRIDPAVALRQD